LAPQGEAQRRYKKKNVVRVTVDFNRATEQPLIDKLDGQPNKAGYIKKLIRDDIGGE
jgi:hypothetical protein